MSEAALPETGELTPAQCLEARALLGWSRDRLAPLVGFSTDSLGKFERGEGVSPSVCFAALRTVLEAAGVEFPRGDDGTGAVRLKGPEADQN